MIPQPSTHATLASAEANMARDFRLLYIMEKQSFSVPLPMIGDPVMMTIAPAQLKLNKHDVHLGPRLHCPDAALRWSWAVVSPIYHGHAPGKEIQPPTQTETETIFIWRRWHGR